MGLMFGPWELSLRMGWPVTPRSLGEWWCPFLEIRNTEDVGKNTKFLENRRNQVHIQCLGPQNATTVLKM